MTTQADYTRMLLEGLVALWNAGGLRLKETGPGSGVFRYRFRAGGWPIDVDLDTTVLQLRAYHQRDVIASGGVREPVISALVGAGDEPKGGGNAKEAVDALRATVAQWKQENARLSISSPRVARHQDGWNNA